MKTLILALILTVFTMPVSSAHQSCKTLDDIRVAIERDHLDAIGTVMSDTEFETFRAATNLQIGDQAIWFISPSMATTYIGILLNECQIGSGEFKKEWLLRLLGEVAI